MALAWVCTLRITWSVITVTGERSVLLVFSLNLHSRVAQISRLYQPLQLDADQEEDDIEIDETPLLPSHFQPGASRSTGKNGTTTRTDAGKVRLDNVWDEGEELFNLGDDSDDDEPRSAKSSTTPHFANEGSVAPKIVVTDSDP